MPVSRIKRVGLSFASTIVSESAVVVAWFAISNQSHDITDLLGLEWIVFVFTFAGWLISLPLVLLFDRTDGWRFWVLLAYGVLLGPAVILLWALSAGSLFTDRGLAFTSGIALTISSAATAIYMSILRHCSRDSIEAAR